MVVAGVDGRAWAAPITFEQTCTLGGAYLSDGLMSPDISEDFLARRATEVLDAVHPVESDAPTRSKFNDTSVLTSVPFGVRAGRRIVTTGVPLAT